MINLLPPKEKEKLKLERIKNLVIILCGAIFVSLVCFTLILLFIKFSLLSEVDNSRYVLQDAEKKYNSANIPELKNIIEKYNQIMDRALFFYKNQFYASSALETILGITTPDGVRFFSIYLDNQKYDDKIEARISGNSNTRDNLILFRENVESQENIKNISFSQESWLNPKNNNFNLTFYFLKNGN
jgi:hypothetical protein